LKHAEQFSKSTYILAAAVLIVVRLFLHKFLCKPFKLESCSNQICIFYLIERWSDSYKTNALGRIDWKLL